MGVDIALYTKTTNTDWQQPTIKQINETYGQKDSTMPFLHILHAPHQSGNGTNQEAL
jgi:hypothetical protein